jgi:hypothetical protein
MMKSRRIQCVDQLKYTWEKCEMRPRFWYENSKERGNLEDLDLEGRKILTPILGNASEDTWTRLI